VEKKWDTVIPADLKRLSVSGTYTLCPAGHKSVNYLGNTSVIVQKKIPLRVYTTYLENLHNFRNFSHDRAPKNFVNNELDMATDNPFFF
jgi:hypothetical protein